MTRILLPSTYYALDSSPEDSADLLNVYAEPVPSGSRGNAVVLNAQQAAETGQSGAVMLRSVPPLVQTNVALSSGEAPLIVGTGPILAQNGDLAGITYIVSGTHAFRINFGTTVTITDLGSIGAIPAAYTIGGPLPNIVTIAVGVLAVMICNPPNAYQCPHDGTAVVQITDENFPGADSVCYLDGFFVFNLGVEVFCSNLLDAATFDALNFNYADSVPNSIRRVVTYLDDIWAMGYDGLEIFYDAGTANFPFAPRPGGSIQVGCRSTASVVVCNQGIFWLGSDGKVYTASGYRAVPISNYALENWMARHNDYDSVDAFATVYAGHRCYYLNFYGSGMNGAATFVYDMTTKLWHRRASAADGTGVYRGARASQFEEVSLVGDRTSGSIMVFQQGAQSLGNQPLVRFVCPPIYGGTLRRFMRRLELEMDLRSAVAGTPAVMLDYSDDGGVTWSTPRAPSSQNTLRAFWTRVGSFRERILRFTFPTGFAEVYALDDLSDDGAT